MFHIGMFVLALSALPIAHVGRPLAAPATSTVFQPGGFHTAVRIPRTRDRLFVIGNWLVQDLHVTIVRTGGRESLQGGKLPGARFGVELPADAWKARSVEIDGTSVSALGAPILVAGTTLYSRAVVGLWPAIALFGLLAGLAAIAAIIGIGIRSALLAWFAALTGLEAILAIPILGALRPPAIVNQPLHGLLASLGIIATIAFAREYLGRTIMTRRAYVLCVALGLAQMIYFVGHDLWQDRWPQLTSPYDLALYMCLNVALAAIGVSAMRSGRSDATWFVFAQIASILGYLAQVTGVPAQGEIIANVVGVIALSCALALTLRRREDERVHLERAVRIDALTGLINRGTFDAILLAEWSRASRAGTELALIMIDVDQFKQYNDEFGHLQGDEALRIVGKMLARFAQRTEDCVARYGGEEFVMLLPGADIVTAVDVAERIRCETQKLEVSTSPATTPLTVSLGVAATVPHMSLSPATLVRLADDALYKAKRRGRNRVFADGASVQARAALQ